MKAVLQPLFALSSLRRVAWRPKFEPAARSGRSALTLSPPTQLMVPHGRTRFAEIDRMARRRREVRPEPSADDGGDLRTAGRGRLAAVARGYFRPHFAS